MHRSLSSFSPQVQVFAPEDPESGDRYVTSPLSGTTYVLPHGRPDSFLTRAGLWLDGLRSWSIETVDPVADAIDYQASAPLPSLPLELRSQLDAAWAQLQSKISGTSLLRLAKLVDTHRALEAKTPKHLALDIAHESRLKSRTNCLLHSFWQVYVLRRSSLPCTLYVGVWMPMREAHAWVMTPTNGDSHRPAVIGDSIDRVMHYAPTLAFSFGGSSRSV